MPLHKWLSMSKRSNQADLKTRLRKRTVERNSTHCSWAKRSSGVLQQIQVRSKQTNQVCKRFFLWTRTKSVATKQYSDITRVNHLLHVKHDNHTVFQEHYYLPWWKEQATLKCWYISTRLHGAMTQKTAVFKNKAALVLYEDVKGSEGMTPHIHNFSTR